MSDLILTDEVANSNNALLPAVVFLPDTKLPEKEYEECLLKAKAMFEVLQSK